MLTTSIITDLGSQEVLEHAQVFDLELHDEGLLLVETESGEVGQRGGLVEHIQIPERELLLHRLTHLQSRLVLLLVAVVLAKLHRARAYFALH